MRRSRCGSILTGLLTLWLALTQSDVAVMHAWQSNGHAHAAASSAHCPTHSAATEHERHGSPSGNDGAQRCGCCCACVAPALVSPPSASVSLLPSAHLVVVRPATIAAVAYHHTAPAHARPPSQGPPVRTA